MQTIYETPRLRLKILEPESAPCVLAYYKRNRDFLAPWEPLREDSFYTEAFHQRQLSNDLENMKNGSLLRLWIFPKDDDSRTIGTIGFSHIVRGAFQSCFLGYKLDETAINKGFMTEALRKSIAIVFEEYRLHRVEANILPRNARSLRVTEKLGFVNEGLSRQYLKINGNWEDHIHMVLLNPLA